MRLVMEWHEHKQYSNSFL